MAKAPLSQVVDEHLVWFVSWHRLAFIELSPRAEQINHLVAPKSFPRWYQQVLTSLPQDQPVMDRLAILHDQLHKLARLVIIKTPDGQTLASEDYDAIAIKFQEFIHGIRQLERAFSIAASGIDLLTGLRSRVGMLDDLAKEQQRFERMGKLFCLAMLDVDHFKQINDTHGHDAGDHVLAAIADVVQRELRGFDDAYRVGGEEFLLCLKEADLATGLGVVERLRQRIAENTMRLPNGTSLNATASFGLVAAGRELTIETLLQRADQGLYRAKKSGRNCVVVIEEN